MKWLFLFLLISPLEAADYELVVVAGQSNAQGWKGDACRYPKGPPEIDRSIPMYYASPGVGSSGGKWLGLGPQQGLFKRGHFGPEITFARKLVANGRRPAIFKFALGGTQLEDRWKRPGQGGLYDQMVRELDKARREFGKSGHRLVFGGLIWIQGESDAMDAGSAARYQENLTVLLNDFRSKVAGNPRLPVVLGVDEQHKFVVRRPIIVETQKSLANADPKIVFTTMHHLRKADGTHLTPKALAEHGKRLASAYLQIAL